MPGPFGNPDSNELGPSADFGPDPLHEEEQVDAGAPPDYGSVIRVVLQAVRVSNTY